MAKTSKPAPKKPVNKMASTRVGGAFAHDLTPESKAILGRSGSSTGHYSGAAPRVGNDKKKGTVVVAKPSRVQSGIKLKSKKK